ncbi:alpha/beta fold hydrolase [Pedobacter immunditicola]|uniref:alpha/beta fold hydrolase n=1 Tax=Pedobacter immunditicola TaxID=3133440 RepID=UPI0030960E7D
MMKAIRITFQTALWLTLGLILCFNSKAQTKYIKANNINIAYESFGNTDAETILLIHGTGAQLVDWPVEFCQALANRGYRVIRFDNRDVGLSTKFDSLGAPDWGAIIPFVKKCEPAPLPYTLVDMAEDATGLLEALNIEKAHIVGGSMGGAIAQLITINHPEKVLTLTSIMASSGNPDLPQGDEKALKAMSMPPPNTKDPDILATYLVNIYKVLGSLDDEPLLRKRALAHIKRSWYPEGTTRQVAAVLIGDNCDRRTALSKIQVPTMVIHGDADPLVKLVCGEEVATVVPNAELCVVEGMGHVVSERFIQTVTDCILRNVKSIEEESDKISYYAKQ